MTNPLDNLDLQDASSVAHAFDAAAQVNLTHPHRRGCLIDLPAGQDSTDKQHFRGLILSGDIHDHMLNYRKLLKFAALDANEDTQLLLQEIIHSARLVNGMDLSYRLAAEVAALQTTFPHRVHVVLANHELGQLTGRTVAKHGSTNVDAFTAGLDHVFADDAPQVRDALNRWITSLPLALRTATGILCAHSLPSPHKKHRFDPTVLDRELTDADRAGPNGSAHLMVWGRALTQDWADVLAQKWNVTQFVLGHQHAEMGYDTLGSNILILNSDHDHGVILPLDLSRPYTREQLIEQIVPLAAMSPDA